MTVIANSSKTLSNLLVSQLRPELGRGVVVHTMFEMPMGGEFKIGDVALQGAGKTPAIVLENVPFKTGDKVSVLMLVGGPATVQRTGLNIQASGSGLTEAEIEAKIIAAGIQILDGGGIGSYTGS